MGGVDLEPETPYRHISNVTFRRVVFEENKMTQVYGARLTTEISLLEDGIRPHYLGGVDAQPCV
jgi:hypothetical protein